MQTRLIPVLALAALAACTGDDNATTTFGATTERVNLPEGYTIVDNTDGTFTVSDGTTSQVLPKLADAANGGSARYRPGNTTTYELFFAETSSGQGTAASLIRIVDGQPQIEGAMLQRNGETTVPTSGTATFTGHSATFFEFGTQSSEGNVELTANFGTSEINGAITDRIRYGSSGLDPLPDITLNIGTISGGGFSGTTTGGFNGGTTAGTFSGLFTGPNGDELVGEWGYTDGDFTAQGIFSAEQ